MGVSSLELIERTRRLISYIWAVGGHAFKLKSAHHGREMVLEEIKETLLDE